MRKNGRATPAVLIAAATTLITVTTASCAPGYDFRNPFDPEAPGSPLGHTLVGRPMIDGAYVTLSTEPVPDAVQYQVRLVPVEAGGTVVFGGVVDALRTQPEWSGLRPANVFSAEVRYQTSVTYRDSTELAWSRWTAFPVVGSPGQAIVNTITCGTPIILGDAGSWPAANVVLLDSVDGSVEYSTLDVTAISIACDDTFVYFRVDKAGTNLPPAGEYRNHWLYFKLPENPDGAAFHALEVADFAGSVGINIYDQFNNSAAAAVEPDTLDNSWFDLSVTRASFDLARTYRIEFYTHSTTGGGSEWLDNGDRNKNNAVFHVNFITNP